MTIRLGMKGLAKYMTAQPAAQRKILRDHKFPNPEGQAQARYYRDALSVIERVISKRTTVNDARGLAARWRDSALDQTVPRRTRRNSNARALEQYIDHFAEHDFKPLAKSHFRLTRGAVVIGATPDLHVREGKREYLLRLEFASRQPEDQLLRVMSQIMFEATTGLASTTIGIVDVPRGRVVRGARMGSRIKADIVAACRSIEAIWPTITPAVAASAEDDQDGSQSSFGFEGDDGDDNGPEP